MDILYCMDLYLLFILNLLILAHIFLFFTLMMLIIVNVKGPSPLSMYPKHPYAIDAATVSCRRLRRRHRLVLTRLHPLPRLRARRRRPARSLPRSFLRGANRRFSRCLRLRLSLSAGRTNFVFSRSVISDPVASSGVSLVCEGGCGGDLSVVCCSVRLNLPRERTRTEASSEEEAVGVAPSIC